MSPLLSNIYLDPLDHLVARSGFEMVRYADDFVVMARYQGPQLVARVESLLEDWMGLKINRDKTRVVKLTEEGVHLDFLGYTFWYAPDLFFGRGRYLKLEPAAKSLAREGPRRGTQAASAPQPKPGHCHGGGHSEAVTKLAENHSVGSDYFRSDLSLLLRSSMAKKVFTRSPWTRETSLER